MLIICDIDGTIADHRHRKGIAKHKKAAAMLKDQPVMDVINVLDALIVDGHDLVICTARSEKYRKATKKWLKLQGIKYKRLLMRPLGDKRPDWEVKQSMNLLFNEEVLCVFEDKPSCVKMWRRNGFTTFACKLTEEC